MPAVAVHPHRRFHHAPRPLRQPRPLRPSRQPVLPRRYDLRRGSGGWGSSVKDSEAILSRYLEAGGNFIDTANIYTRATPRRSSATTSRRQPGRRDRVVIATKFYGNLYPGDPNGGGNGPQVDPLADRASLRRLQTDYIDLYWMHMWTCSLHSRRRCAPSTTSSAPARFATSASPTHPLRSWPRRRWRPTSGLSPLIALQIEYSLLERPSSSELVPMARELGLGVTPWSPLKCGALSGKYTRDNAGKVEGGRAGFVQSSMQSAAQQEKTYALLDVVRKIAEELGSTPARVALAWVQGRPGITSTILGARTMAHLEDNLKALELKLTDGQRKTLDDASAPAPYCLGRFLSPPFSFGYGGTTVDGIASPAIPLAPKNDSERH